uniref:SFRICE_010251 n=1 Tax=Spodoptera frugiperda TaxID=7108 RepID=A0A2H1VPY1_SPOFR
MKRECKVTAYDCLQGLYETVLSLADSRARHKYNLERERSRHAQELVQVERAHTRDVMALKAELSLMRSDLTDTKKEAKGIREWLGHETLEAFKGIKEVKEEVKQSNLNNIKEHEKTRLCAVGTPGDPKWDSMGEGLLKIERNISNLSNQLDVLRKVLEQVKNDLNRPKDTPTPTSQVSESDLLTSAKFEMEVDKLQKLLAEVKAKPTPIPPPPPQQPITLNIEEQLRPISERLEMVSADIRVLRDKEPSVQTQTVPSLDAELAVVEVKKTLQDIQKGVADLGKVEKPTQQQQGPKTFAQVASTPKPPKPLQPNHTLIVSSTDPAHTGDNVIERIRVALDLKTSGARVDTVRKARNQKVILRCASKTDLNLVKEQVKTSSGLKVQEPKPQNPMVCIRGVLSSYSDDEIVDLLKAQNKHLLQNIAVGEQVIKMRYRKRARNPHECHSVLELSPKLWQCLTQVEKIHIGIKRCPILHLCWAQVEPPP